jgi:SNF2-related domain/Domain of unknown function (DUF3535)
VYASVAGAVIAVGLPSKITSLVRALMTSLKNESSNSRQRQSSVSMTRLLFLINDDQSFVAAWTKILGNLCDMISHDFDDMVVSSPTAATRVVQSLVGNVPSKNTLADDLPPLWSRLEVLCVDDPFVCDDTTLVHSLNLLRAVCGGLGRGTYITESLIDIFVPTLVKLACQHRHVTVRTMSSSTARLFCSTNSEQGLQRALATITPFVKDRRRGTYRLGACQLLKSLVEDAGLDLCPFVRYLIPVVMSLMMDPILECSKIANNIFAALVRVAPLVRVNASVAIDRDGWNADKDDSVIDHLILGKPLPPCILPVEVKDSLRKSGTVLRNYQREGIAWLRFLQSVNLNGALCDSMGLGKTLQALVGVALSHTDSAVNFERSRPLSLVVCPSTLVGHWVSEIEKFFPEKSIFNPLGFAGSTATRKKLWTSKLPDCNIVVTSYSVLRTDADLLAEVDWRFCILDEGHLLKNPKTGKSLNSAMISEAQTIYST